MTRRWVLLCVSLLLLAGPSVFGQVAGRSAARPMPTQKLVGFLKGKSDERRAEALAMLDATAVQQVAVAEALRETVERDLRLKRASLLTAQSMSRLALSSRDEDIQFLVKLIESPDVNVAFVAAASLAERKEPELLAVGFEPGRESLPKAKGIYDAAVKAGDKSPELAYAYGLVLAKQFKPKDAVEQFRLAADHPEVFYQPAWQALIFSHFTAKDTTAGYDRLFDFAKRLQTAPPEVPLDNQKRLVEWMGQLVGALDKLAESPKAQEVVRKNDLRLRDLLGEALQTSYDEGRHDAEDAALLVEVELDAAKEEQLAKNEQDRVEKLSKTEADAEAAKKKAEAVKKSAEDWKRWLDDQLKQSDRLLARLEEEHGILERRAIENLEAQDQIDREINAIRQRAITGRARGRIGNMPIVNARTTEQQIDQFLNQKILLQTENDRLTQESLAIHQSAARAVRERQGVIQQYQQKTGQLVKEEAAVQKWQDRLKKDSTKLKAPASDKGGAVTRTLTKVKSLRTYIDFDLADERQRLLDQIAPAKRERPAEPVRR